MGDGHKVTCQNFSPRAPSGRSLTRMFRLPPSSAHARQERSYLSVNRR